MSDQPEALFLADVIENDPQSKAHHDAAAACLRRLHAECEALRQIVADYPPIEAELREVADSLFRAEAERDALRADAERYQWLRDIDTGPAQIWELISDDAQPYMTLKSGNILDAVIDAARAALKEAK